MQINEKRYNSMPPDLQRLFIKLPNTGSDEVLEIFPECNGEIGRSNRKTAGNYNASSYKVGVVTDYGIKDNGSAARFFYQAQWTPEELNILEANTNNELKQKWIEIAKLYNDIDLTPIEAFIASMLNDDLSGCSMKYCAKASKSERDENCGELDNEKYVAGNYSQSPVCKTCNLTLNGTNNHNNCSGDVYYREMKSQHTKNNHPTVKPLALMEYLIKLITPQKGIVLDPFMGSGSTLIAARKLGYKAIGIELNKDYAEIAVKRLAQGVLL